MFAANCSLCGSENSENVCGSCASLLDTEGFDFASRAEQTSKLFVCVCLLVYIFTTNCDMVYCHFQFSYLLNNGIPFGKGFRI